VTEAARLLDIEHLLERKPKALSGGQRQRVAVGRAIVREPAAFLFDEPLSNLDAKLRVETRAELKRLHQRLKTTTIYVTHDQEEAMTLGDRIIVMMNGLIQQEDAPLQTYNYPVNRFVAGFIGMPPMNFFDGIVNAIDGNLVFEEGLIRKNDTQIGGVGELTLPGNGFTLQVPDRLKAALSGKVGQNVVLGVRPEHVYLRPLNEAGSCGPLQLKLNVIEPLGNDMDMYLETRLAGRVTGRVKAQSGLSVDAQVTMYVDLSKIHFFEPGATGMNLSLSKELSHAIA
jgi:multiple sugar transport system ATP-binding protein